MTRRVFLVLAGGWLWPAAAKAREQESPERAAIQEAVLRYILAKSETKENSYRLVWFIEVGGHDPDPDLLRRLRHRHSAGVRRKLLPASRALPEQDLKVGILDQRTGERGVILRVRDELKRLPSGEVEIEGGYVAGGLNAEGNVYRLARAHGHWQVIQVRRKWVA